MSHTTPPMSESDRNDESQEQDAPRLGVTFYVRAPVGLKGRAVKASRRRNMKLTPWLIEAIEEKCDREEAADEPQKD